MPIKSTTSRSTKKSQSKKRSVSRLRKVDVVRKKSPKQAAKKSPSKKSSVRKVSAPKKKALKKVVRSRKKPIRSRSKKRSQSRVLLFVHKLFTTFSKAQLVMMAIIAVLGGVVVHSYFRTPAIASGPKKIIPEVYTQPMVVGIGTKTLSLQPASGVPVRVKQKDVRYIYEKAYKYTDVVQTNYPYKIKEQLVFYRPGHPVKFTYKLGNVESYVVEEDEEGNIIFYDRVAYEESSELARVFTIPTPFIEDQVGKHSFSAVTTVVGEDTITISVDENWLKTAAYPVVLDPTVEISVLNVQSYPIVGGQWEIRFTTDGSETLQIEGLSDGGAHTIFGEDISFASLKCGEESREPEKVGNSYVYSDWSCEKEAKFVVNVHKRGEHHLQFDFGGQIADAYNDAVDPVNIEYYVQAQKSDWGAVDNGSPTDKTICYTDDVTNTSCIRLAKKKEVVRIEFSSGLSTLAAGDTVTVNIRQLRNAGSLDLMPYTSATGVGITNRITIASGNLIVGDNVFTLTSAFINDLYDQGSDAFALRLTAIDGSEMKDRAETTEIDADFTVTPPNEAPTITSVIDTPDPTNVKRSVTFIVDWNDIDSTLTKTKVCSTDSLSGQVCDGTTYASSSAFSTMDPARVIYNIASGDAGNTITYYVFVCDDASACNASGTSGTFSVNMFSALPNVGFR